MIDPDTLHDARHAIADDGERINRMAIAATDDVVNPHTPRHSLAHRSVVAPLSLAVRAEA